MKTGHQKGVSGILSNGKQWRIRDIVARLTAVAAQRTVLEDLRLLHSFGLVEFSGHGAGARWWLKPMGGGIAQNNAVCCAARVGNDSSDVSLSIALVITYDRE